MSLQETITKRIEEQQIPSLVAFELLKLLEDEDHSIKQVVRLIENDPSLTTEVLKVANSATYFRGKEVTTVSRAVLLMGEMMVVGIAICASSSIVSRSPLAGYHCEEGQMWAHSLKTAMASRELTTLLKRKIPPGLAFTAGLLIDIGKSIVSEFLALHRDELAKCSEDIEVEDFLAAERKLLGTDHAEVGYTMANHWGLPEVLCIAIRDHHRPATTEKQYRELVYSVHLGDQIAQMGGGPGSDSMGYLVDEHYPDYFDIKKKDFPRLLLKIQDEFEVIKETIMSDRKG